MCFLFPNSALSQSRDGGNSSVSAAIGYSWYSPQDGTRFKTQPEKFEGYSGMAFGVRALLRTPGIWPRLSLGAEYGIHALAGEKSTFVIIVDTGQPTVNNVNAHYFQLLADVQLLRLSVVNLHAMLGGGIVDDDETRVLRAGWLGRVVGSFPLFWDKEGDVGMSFDLEVSSVNSFNGMQLRTFGLLGGISFRW